jgi:hypothetical protein
MLLSSSLLHDAAKAITPAEAPANKRNLRRDTDRIWSLFVATWLFKGKLFEGIIQLFKKFNNKVTAIFVIAELHTRVSGFRIYY